MLGNKEFHKDERRLGNKRVDNDMLGNKYFRMTNRLNHHQQHHGGEEPKEKEHRSPLEKLNPQNRAHRMHHN